MVVDPVWTCVQKQAMVTTESLGRARIPDAPYDKPDGTSYRLDTDYFGNKRNKENPVAGPFERRGEGSVRMKVWQGYP